MGLADILVHIDHYASPTSRLDLAISLAKQHQARLTGLLVIKQRYPAEAVVDAARAMFHQKVALAGIEGQWQCVDGSGIAAGMTGIIHSHAHCSDLIVIGQGSLESADMGVPIELPEGLVLVSGLPVMVVPTPEPLPRSVGVCW